MTADATRMPVTRAESRVLQEMTEVGGAYDVSD